MKLKEMIALLNEDLAREYAHWHFYMYAAVNVVGMHREEYREFFLKEAAGEMKHIQEWSDLILGLGGVPTTTVAPFKTGSKKAKHLLSIALEMEQEVVTNFVIRMKLAEELTATSQNQHVNFQDKIDGRYIEVFLEDQLMDSRSAVDNLKQILAGV